MSCAPAWAIHLRPPRVDDTPELRALKLRWNAALERPPAGRLPRWSHRELVALGIVPASAVRRRRSKP